MSIKKINILDIIFPQVCGICGKINSEGLCRKCNKKLENIAEYQIVNEEFQKNKYFENLLYIFKYEGLIRKILIDYKFNEKSYIYVSFVKFIINNKKMVEKLKSYDTIIPVPISKKRMKERGYNQSTLIAKELSKKIKIDLEINCIIKVKNVKEQSKLNKEQREKNIQNVYELKNKQKIINKKILLIDDIYTTGSTVNECSKILGQGKPAQIDVLVVARD